MQVILELKCPTSIALPSFPAGHSHVSQKTLSCYRHKQYLFLSIPFLSSGIPLPPMLKHICGTISFSSVPDSFSLNPISVPLKPAPAAFVGGNSQHVTHRRGGSPPRRVLFRAAQGSFLSRVTDPIKHMPSSSGRSLLRHNWSLFYDPRKALLFH